MLAWITQFASTPEPVRFQQIQSPRRRVRGAVVAVADRQAFSLLDVASGVEARSLAAVHAAEEIRGARVIEVRRLRVHRNCKLHVVLVPVDSERVAAKNRVGVVEEAALDVRVEDGVVLSSESFDRREMGRLMCAADGCVRNEAGEAVDE